MRNNAINSTIVICRSCEKTNTADELNIDMYNDGGGEPELYVTCGRCGASITEFTVDMKEVMDWRRIDRRFYEHLQQISNVMSDGEVEEFKEELETTREMVLYNV